MSARWIDPWVAFLTAILLCIGLAILLGGCSQTQERSVRVREGMEQGKPTRWVEREQSESKTQVVDPQAIGEAVAAAVKGAVPGADVLIAALKPTQEAIASMKSAPPPNKDWMQTAAELAGLGLLGTTGYQALKQRERNKHLPKKD